jgi:hypothetical protein
MNTDDIYENKIDINGEMKRFEMLQNGPHIIMGRMKNECLN